MHPIKQRTAAGFTLVEMLVVIAIIGILASLITVAASAALSRAKDVRVKSEIDQLDMALKAFKQQYGAYPPCDLSHPTTNTTLQAFVAQAFPRYNFGTGFTQLQSDLQTLGVDLNNPHPDRALAFWLGGFSPDVTNPFLGAGQRTPLFNFDSTRLICMSGTAAGSVYVPPSTYPLTSTPAAQSQLGLVAYMPSVGLASTGTPYVYFDSSVYPVAGLTTGVSAQSGTAFNASTPPPRYTVSNPQGTAVGVATPYVLDENNSGSFNAGVDTYCNPTSFQIISAGQDQQFGAFGSVFRLFPVGIGYDSTGLEDDNISNFTTSSNLGDAKPN